jgi:hypothetical protein
VHVPRATGAGCHALPEARAEDEDAAGITRALAKLLHPGRDDSLTETYNSLACRNVDAVRLAGKVLRQYPDSWGSEVRCLVAVMGMLGAGDESKPYPPQDFDSSEGIVARDPRPWTKNMQIDAAEWAKWASQVPSSLKPLKLPTLSNDRLLELLFSNEALRGHLSMEAGRVLCRRNKSADFLKKAAEKLSQLDPDMLSEGIVLNASAVLASDEETGQKLLLRLLAKMPKEHRELAEMELLRAGCAHFARREFDRLKGTQWKEACDRILQSGNSCLIAQMFEQARRKEHSRILSHALNKSPYLEYVEDVSPLLHAIRAADTDEDTRKKLTESFCERFFGSKDGVVLNSLQIARLPTAAERCDMKLQTFLERPLEMRLSGFSGKDATIKVEFVNRSDRMLRLNAASLKQAREDMCGEVEQTEKGWRIGASVSSAGRDFYPCESDVVNLKPGASVKLAHKLKVIKPGSTVKGTITIQYWNSVDRYFAREGENAVLKSDQTIFRGVLETSVRIP